MIEFPRTALEALEVASLCLVLARNRIEERGAEGNPETFEEEIDERLRCEELMIKISVLHATRLDADADTATRVREAANRTLERVREVRALVHRSIEQREARRATANAHARRSKAN